MLTGSLNSQMNTMPVQIFSDITSPRNAIVARAWGTALTLVFLVLILNLIARAVARRSRVGMIGPDTTGTTSRQNGYFGRGARQSRAGRRGSGTGGAGSRSCGFRSRGLNAYYGKLQVIKGMDIDIRPNEVTAIIGPSGSGKSTVVRCINRMHEEIPGARTEGTIELDGLDVYDPKVDVTAVRRMIGMVFQRPNPFPTMSIFDNVAAGLRLARTRGVDVKDRVRRVRCARLASGMRSTTG